MVVKKVKAHIRGLKCKNCNTKLLSMYARNQTTFTSVANYYYCEGCKRIYKIEETEEKGEKQ